MMAFAEMLPYHENRMYLNEDKRDKWGLPTVTFDCEIKENEKIMRKHMATAGAEMLEAAGFKNISTDESNNTFDDGLSQSNAPDYIKRLSNRLEQIRVQREALLENSSPARLERSNTALVAQSAGYKKSAGQSKPAGYRLH